MNWSASYVGSDRPVPHCWALVRDVYRIELGIELPSYEGRASTSAERAEIARLIASEEQDGPWQPVPLADVRAFDLLAFRQGAHRSHVGVAIDARHMLHFRKTTLVERFTAPSWQYRLSGVYRHVQMAFEPGLKGGGSCPG